MKTDTPELLSARLAEAGYVRERAAPRINDVNYLCFTDLLQAVARFARGTHGRVFDYGCGGAPYRELFAHCQAYIRADLAAGPNIDRVLEPSGATGEPDAAYDAVFSAQVLEHVPDAEAYVREAARILRPGGELFVSTHGLFQEHGCPHDYQRWTVFGLKQLLARHGLVVVETYKLTTALRGLLQLQHHFMEHLRCRHRPAWHYPLACVRKFYAALLRPGLNWV